MPSIIGGKKSFIYLKVKDDIDNNYIIEMQKQIEKVYFQRIAYFSSDTITNQIEQEVDHAGINPVITISIMSKNCFNPSVTCISYHAFK